MRFHTESVRYCRLLDRAEGGGFKSSEHNLARMFWHWRNLAALGVLLSDQDAEFRAVSPRRD